MKKLYRWILIAVLFQVLVLSYIEFIYLPNRGAVRATAYDNGGADIKDRKIRIASDMEDITVSYNGFYMACRQNGKLLITDVRSGKKVKALEAGKDKFSYFRWLPDRDMLIYSVKAPDGKDGQVRISTYDLGQKLERSYPLITGLADGSEVIDIELSPLTNVVYSVIKTSDTRVRVYKFNIMDDLSFIMKTDTDSSFKETMYSDTLVYQVEDQKIVVRNGKNGRKTNVPVNGKQRLITLDAEDNIYVGVLDGSGKIASINFGKSGQDRGSWEKLVPASPIPVSDVYITPNGSIYKKSANENSVSDLKDNKITSFEGDIVEMLDNYVVSKDDNRLRLTVVRK